MISHVFCSCSKRSTVIWKNIASQVFESTLNEKYLPSFMPCLNIIQRSADQQREIFFVFVCPMMINFSSKMPVLFHTHGFLCTHFWYSANRGRRQRRAFDFATSRFPILGALAWFFIGIRQFADTWLTTYIL